MIHLVKIWTWTFSFKPFCTGYFDLSTWRIVSSGTADHRLHTIWLCYTMLQTEISTITLTNTLFRPIRYHSDFFLHLVVPHDYVIPFFVNKFYRNSYHTLLRVSYRCAVSHWLSHSRYIAKASRVWRVKNDILLR